jgi:hypothetical protein
MTQYSYNLILSDAEINLINYLMQNHLKKLNNKKLPIPTSEKTLKNKLNLLIPNIN